MNQKFSVLEKIQMECPICGTVHEIEKRSRTTQALIKDEIVEYQEVYYVCPLCTDDENEFVPGGIMDENLLRARNAYRVGKGLLTSEQIADIRKTYDLTQSEFSALLGWGEVTVTRYESKSIQDETYDKLMRMVDENPKFALDSLKAHKNRFTDARFQKIRDCIQSQIDSVGISFLKKQEILTHYSAFDTPSEWNGFRVIDLDKVGAMMAYFAKKFRYIYKVRLMKLLWYADALSFHRYGNAMSGLVYTHEQFGALPIGSRDMIYLPSIMVVEEEDDDRTKYRISSDTSDFRCLSAVELEILSDVFNRFEKMNTEQIVQSMHDEQAYVETKMHERIPFTLCNQLKAFP